MHLEIRKINFGTKSALQVYDINQLRAGLNTCNHVYIAS